MHCDDGASWTALLKQAQRPLLKEPLEAAQLIVRLLDRDGAELKSCLDAGEEEDLVGVADEEATEERDLATAAELFNSGRSSAAEPVLRRGIALVPTSSAMLLNLGTLRFPCGFPCRGWLSDPP